ncbi:hypothetical protein G9A89_014300 [Geosiphon pyriformis]|nr:hypothetical protein G9A89_014300 [Geosiphon pyriformis]
MGRVEPKTKYLFENLISVKSNEQSESTKQLKAFFKNFTTQLNLNRKRSLEIKVVSQTDFLIDESTKNLLGPEEQNILTSLETAAKFASLAYCLSKEKGNEMAPSVFESEIIVYFAGIEPTHKQWLDKNFQLNTVNSVGFLMVVNEFFGNWQKAKKNVMDLIIQKIDKVKAIDSIKLIGHGIGGAYALLATRDLKRSIPLKIHIEIITFGQPLVGNRHFAISINKMMNEGVFAFRVTHSDDPVPRLPLKSHKTPSVPLVHHSFEFWIDDDCQCGTGSGSVYFCTGPKEGDFIGENLKECNRGAPMGEFSHNGPYFGYKMGSCSHG